MLGQYLFHVAPSSLDDRILKNGLVPKSKSVNAGIVFRHPDRVYMFTHCNIDVMKAFAKANTRRKTYDPKSGKLVDCWEFSVFRIDFRKIRGLNLYRDSMFQNKNRKTHEAVYSKEPISPKYIEKISGFRLA